MPARLRPRPILSRCSRSGFTTPSWLRSARITATPTPLIRPSSFADFQSNVALPLGKRLGRPPREVAVELAARLDVADLSASPR
jgi:hypothetical protein